jgi:hypothetical protein
MFFWVTVLAPISLLPTEFWDAVLGKDKQQQEATTYRFQTLRFSLEVNEDESVQIDCRLKIHPTRFFYFIMNAFEKLVVTTCIIAVVLHNIDQVNLFTFKVTPGFMQPWLYSTRLDQVLIMNVCEVTQ